MAEVHVAGNCNAPYISYNATESSENSSEYFTEIKTLVLKVLTELSVLKGRVDLLQEEIRRSKVEVSESTDSAVYAQHEVNISIQNLLKNSQVLSREMDVRAGRRELKK
jgi:uncharacterized small protein (DUF1192 family)